MAENYFGLNQLIIGWMNKKQSPSDKNTVRFVELGKIK